MSLYIGVSGGHVLSTVVAVRDDAVVFTVFLDLSLNLHSYPHGEFEIRFADLMHSLATGLGYKNTSAMSKEVRHLTLALPGGATKSEQAEARQCLKRQGWRDDSRYDIVDDTWVGLIGGTLSMRGICAFGGAGASVFVGFGDFQQGKPSKLDGWGPILGDFGSGFRLATRFFEFLGRELDRGNEPRLFRDVARFVGDDLSEVQKVQIWFDQLLKLRPHDWRFDLAKVATPVCIAADRPDTPDPDAVRLIEEVAGEMADTIMIAVGRPEVRAAHLPIVCQGGMFRNNTCYRENVFRSVRAACDSDISIAAHHPAVGAVLMARAQSVGLPEPAVIQSVVDSLQDLPPREREFLKNYSIS